jgi:glycosyltransferase involved in cell wall biosynthesis
LLHNPDQRDALGAMNRRRVVTEYSQERMFAAYSEVFRACRAA